MKSMAIYDAIKNLNKQFEFEPKIENQDRWQKFEKFVVAGMGGSHLAADLLGAWIPESDILIHQDYGLPQVSDRELASRLIVASSYSGNTEEVLDAYAKAKEKNLVLAAISVGGKLLEKAKEDGVPYIAIPDTGIQPRSAVGFMFRALLKVMGKERELAESGKLVKEFNPPAFEDSGRTLAEKLKNRMPVVYTSVRNEALAKNWRVRFHETGKIPAYYNVFPELNHNEMNGFDAVDATRLLSERIHFVFLRDSEDHPRILRRMEITGKLYRDRSFPVEVVEMRGKTRLEKIFSSVSLADWAAYYTAKQYGTDPEEVPMVEEFKKLIA